MVAVTPVWQDLLPFAPEITQEQADALIAGTLARAVVHASCILDPAFPSGDAVGDLLRDVVLRRFRSMGGRVLQTQIGSVMIKYDVDTVDGVFTMVEMAELQQMCRAFRSSPTAVPQYAMPDLPCPAWPDPARRPPWWDR